MSNNNTNAAVRTVAEAETVGVHEVVSSKMETTTASAWEPVAWRINGPAADGGTFTQFVTDSEFANTLRRAGIEVAVTPLYAAPSPQRRRGS